MWGKSRRLNPAYIGLIVVLKPGTKLKDFLAVQSAPHFQSEITKLRHEVEAYAKQFPTIGFEKESMKYRD